MPRPEIPGASSGQREEQKKEKKHDTAKGKAAAAVLLAGLGRCYQRLHGNRHRPRRRHPAPEVEVAIGKTRDVPIYHEWIGTLDGMVNAAIKAQVTGYLLRKLTRRLICKEGQLLFQIDPRPFQAAVDQAKGQLAQANGQLPQAKAQLAQAQAQLVAAEANSAQDAARRGSLHSAGETAGHHPAGPGQRQAE